MNKLCWSTLMCVLLTAVMPARAEHAGQQVYQTCAACHLADGAGIPGAFPPLKDRLAPVASTPEGQAYLASVVLQGLSGAISVKGQTYQGVMQGFGSSLSDEQIADVLNYVLQSFNGTEGAAVMSAETVAAQRQQLVAKPVTSWQLRKSVFP